MRRRFFSCKGKKRDANPREGEATAWPTTADAATKAGLQVFDRLVRSGAAPAVNAIVAELEKKYYYKHYRDPITDALYRATVAAAKLRLTAAVSALIDGAQDPYVLHQAVNGRDAAAIKALLAVDARVLRRDIEGHTPLHADLRNLVSVECAQALVEGGLRADGDSLTYLAQDLHRVQLSLRSCSLSKFTKQSFLSQAHEKHSCLRVLLDGGACVNTRVLRPTLVNKRWEDVDGCEHTALHAWASTGTAEGVRMLLRAGARVDERDGEGRTALYLAVENDNIECVQTLIRAGANVNMSDHLGNAPLHISVGNKNIMKILIANGALLNKKNRLGNAPYSDAKKRNMFNWAKNSGKSGTKQNHKDETLDPLPLENAMGPAVKHTISGDADSDPGESINGRGKQLALSNDVCHSHCIRHSLDDNRNDSFPSNAFTWFKRRRPRFDWRAHKDDEGRTPLHCAVQEENPECVKILIGTGMPLDDRDGEGCTALQTCILTGNIEILKTLAEGGADLTVKDDRGRNALQMAAAMKGVPIDIIRVLVAEGADVNARTLEGDTALHLSAALGTTACVEVLVKAGASVGEANVYRRTALHVAAQAGKVECVKALLEAGCAIDARDDRGFSALHYAALKRNAEAIRTLVNAGANVEH